MTVSRRTGAGPGCIRRRRGTDNLSFEVQTVNGRGQYPRINSLLTERLAPEADGGSRSSIARRAKTPRKLPGICATRLAGEASMRARIRGKKAYPGNFVTGTTRIITATNASHGIDKTMCAGDTRGHSRSIENYLSGSGPRAAIKRMRNAFLLLMKRHRNRLIIGLLANQPARYSTIFKGLA